MQLRGYDRTDYATMCTLHPDLHTRRRVRIQKLGSTRGLYTAFVGPGLAPAAR
jgi:hypothetical protein